MVSSSDWGELFNLINGRAVRDRDQSSDFVVAIGLARGYSFKAYASGSERNGQTPTTGDR